ncbi:MAG: hypothetical protein EBT03_02335 [Betaproteobacteria bacterium]|nr:hypothetical protein [Betaproteobacteria bacterium]NCA15725.1 hypothetical protein [Betaproteobacteria bacterium]
MRPFISPKVSSTSVCLVGGHLTNQPIDLFI